MFSFDDVIIIMGSTVNCGVASDDRDGFMTTQGFESLGREE